MPDNKLNVAGAVQLAQNLHNRRQAQGGAGGPLEPTPPSRASQQQQGSLMATACTAMEPVIAWVANTLSDSDFAQAFQDPILREGIHIAYNQELAQTLYAAHHSGAPVDERRENQALFSAAMEFLGTHIETRATPAGSLLAQDKTSIEATLMREIAALSQNALQVGADINPDQQRWNLVRIHFDDVAELQATQAFRRKQYSAG